MVHGANHRDQPCHGHFLTRLEQVLAPRQLVSWDALLVDNHANLHLQTQPASFTLQPKQCDVRCYAGCWSSSPAAATKTLSLLPPWNFRTGEIRWCRTYHPPIRMRTCGTIPCGSTRHKITIYANTVTTKGIPGRTRTWTDTTPFPPPT